MRSATSSPDSAVERELATLVRKLGLVRGFCFVVLFVADARASRDLRMRLELKLEDANRALVDIAPDSAGELIERGLIGIFDAASAARASRSRIVVWLEAFREAGEPEWEAQRRGFLMRLNERRSRLESDFAAPLVLLLPEDAQRDVATLAPDLWHIRLHSSTVSMPSEGPHDSDAWNDAFALADSSASMPVAAAGEPRPVVYWNSLLAEAEQDQEGSSELSLDDGFSAIQASLDAQRFAEALELVDRLIELMRARVDHQLPLNSVRALELRADALSALGRPAEANESYKAALRMLGVCTPATDQSLLTSTPLWRLTWKLAESDLRLGNVQEADEDATRALAYARALDERRINERESTLRLARSLEQLSHVRRIQKRFREELNLCQDSLTSWRDLYRMGTREPEVLKSLVWTLTRTAGLLRDLGSGTEAMRLYAELLPLLRLLRASGDSGWRIYSALEVLIGDAALESEDYAVAVDAYLESLASMPDWRDMLHSEPPGSVRPVLMLSRQALRGLASVGGLSKSQRAHYAAEALAVLREEARINPGSGDYTKLFEASQQLIDTIADLPAPQ